MFRSIRVKITFLLLSIGLLSGAATLVAFLAMEGEFRDAFDGPVLTTAEQLAETLESRLSALRLETKAAALNPAAADPDHYYDRGADNPLVRDMNALVRSRHGHRVAALYSADGAPYVANTVREDGGKLAIDALLDGKGIAEEPWLTEVIGSSKVGSSTVATLIPPAPNPVIAKLFGDDGMVVAAAAPVRNTFGKAESVWVDYLGPEAFDDALSRAAGALAGKGLTSARVTLLAPDGGVLTDAVDGRTPVHGGRDGDPAAWIAGRDAPSGFTETAPAGHRQSYARVGGGLGWVVLVTVPEAEIYRTLTSAKRLLMIVAGIALGAVCVAGTIAGSRLADPLRRLTRVMDRLVKGELDVVVEGGRRRDEIGDMARAVEVFKSNAAEVGRLTEESEGLKHEAERTRRELLVDLADRFENRFSLVLNTVREATDLSNRAAAIMRERMGSAESAGAAATAATRDTAAGIDTVAAATEQLNASIREISLRVGESAEMASDTAAAAESSRAAVRDLSELAGRIGEIVGLISDIASRTNLLALNATIEAARAGAAGKGFAVVAGEVKALAHQTAEATDQITRGVDEIRVATDRAVDDIRRISEVAGRSRDVALGIAGAIEEQSAATNHISGSVSAAADGARTVVDAIGTVAENVDGAGAVVGDVLEAAHRVDHMIGDLENEVREFAVTVRAA